jgi:hypothetical protein
MARLTPTEATRRLFAVPSQQLELEDGGHLPVYATAVHGTAVTGTAPRLKIAAGMRMVGRVVADDERPWAITFLVEEANYHSDQLARVKLRAVRLALDDTRRGSVRVPAGGAASLTAINCQNVVDGDRVEATVTDLSETGVGLSTNRILRRGDRLLFAARFFTEEIRAEVRVASVRESPGSRPVVGARFIAIDRENQLRLERVLEGNDSRRPPEMNLYGLRELAQAPATSSRWRRLLRRAV